MSAEPRPRVAVVGAGIGGLSAAIALSRIGCDVQVVERARTLSAVGAGISLWPSGLAALAELGLDGPVAELGAEFASVTIRTGAGRVLNTFDRAGVQQRLGGLGVMMHRADLQQVLVTAANDIPVQLGTRCERVTGNGAGGVSLSLSDRRVLTADLVVGADGVHSQVRQCLAAGPPRYTGLTSWRAVIDEDLGVSDAWLSVGSGKQFLGLRRCRAPARTSRVCCPSRSVTSSRCVTWCRFSAKPSAAGTTRSGG